MKELLSKPLNFIEAKYNQYKIQRDFDKAWEEREKMYKLICGIAKMKFKDY